MNEWGFLWDLYYVKLEGLFSTDLGIVEVLPHIENIDTPYYPSVIVQNFSGELFSENFSVNVDITVI